MKLEMYQSVRLKTGERAVVIERYNDGEAYEVDIRLKDDRYEQRTVYPYEIASVFEEIERAFETA